MEYANVEINIGLAIIVLVVVGLLIKVSMEMLIDACTYTDDSEDHGA